MSGSLLTLEVVIFSLALWLGLYLIGRDPRDSRLRWAGLGLVSYALGLALDSLSRSARSPDLALALAQVRWPLLFLPALFWVGAIVSLWPEDGPLRMRLVRSWRYGLLPVVALLYLVGVSTDLIFDVAATQPRLELGYLLFSLAVLLPLLAVLILLWLRFRTVRPQNAVGLLIAATLFFTLGTGLLLFPLDWLPRTWVLPAIAIDLFLLGLAIAILDAFDQGEALLPDFLRSLDYSFFTALLFGGQVALVIFLGTGVTFPMLLLLLATIATSVAIQTFSDHIQALLDRVAFARFPKVRRARADLRAVASALPRVNETLDLAAVDEAEFASLTRRALSHYGDLPRLAASPLTCLPAVRARLAERGAKDDALERAVELKALLAESIARLKPRDQGDFGTSDEWRHYNALYFPYVVGLKPYSRRAQNDHLDPPAQAALEWFRSQVPERTLYNWQTAAAKLVAYDLRTWNET